MNLAALDLNLLIAFEALYAERGVARAGVRIGLSQPGMSNTLARLRSVFGDPLFLRKGKVMTPTPRAIAIAQPVSEALALIRSALDDRKSFAAATAEIRFRVLTSDYCEMAVLAPFFRRLESRPSRITVEVRRAASLYTLPVEELAGGDLDIALGFFPELLPPGLGLVQTRLSQEILVGLAAVGRFPRPAISLREFVSARQVRVTVGPGCSCMIDELLAKQGHKRLTPCDCTGFLAVPWIVAGTGLLGVVPEKLARAAGPSLRLRPYRLPLKFPPLGLGAIWHERKTSDPAHQWLRRELVRACLEPAPGNGRRTPRTIRRVNR